MLSRSLKSLSLLLLAAPYAHATMTVTPVNGGALFNSTYWYAVKATTGDPTTGPNRTTVDPIPSPNANNANGAIYPVVGFSVLDVRVDQNAELSLDTLSGNFYNQTNAFVFDVVTNTTAAAGKQLLFTASVTDGTTTRRIPIGFVVPSNGTPQFCGGTESSSNPCQDISGAANATSDNPRPVIANPSNNLDIRTYFYAAKATPNQILRVGIYPKDICQNSNWGFHTTAAGCSSAQVAPQVAPLPTNALMPLKFEFHTGTDTGPPPANDPAIDSTAVNMNMQVDPPSFQCPSPAPAALAGVYFPGDGQINLNGSVFGMTTVNSPTVLTDRAPAETLIVVARKSATAITDPFSFSTSNDNLQRVSAGYPNQLVLGFDNTSPQDESLNKYDLSFLIRDATGMVAPASSACHINGVQTSRVFGFLQKSNCFIATAAFQSMDAAPVALLRQFRDEVLLKSSPGKAFVRWYYAWSPNSAKWLLEHDLFRGPVLLALVPVQIIAWLVLHPVLGAALGLISLTMVSGTLVFRFRRYFEVQG